MISFNDCTSSNYLPFPPLYSPLFFFAFRSGNQVIASSTILITASSSLPCFLDIQVSC